MSSVYQEAWESLRWEMAKKPTEEYEGMEVVGIMSRILAKARLEAKETLKELRGLNYIKMAGEVIHEALGNRAREWELVNEAKDLCSCPKCGKDTMVKNKCVVCK